MGNSGEGGKRGIGLGEAMAAIALPPQKLSHCCHQIFACHWVWYAAVRYSLDPEPAVDRGQLLSSCHLLCGCLCLCWDSGGFTIPFNIQAVPIIVFVFNQHLGCTNKRVHRCCRGLSRCCGLGDSGSLDIRAWCRCKCCRMLCLSCMRSRRGAWDRPLHWHDKQHQTALSWAWGKVDEAGMEYRVSVFTCSRNGVRLRKWV